MQCKPWLKNGIRAVGFGLALLAAVLVVGHYLMPHSNRYLTGYTAGGILGEDFDTIDVLVMGDSNAAQGVSPMEWYSQNGITGYTYASGWLSVYNIYYRLQNIYTEQTPRVVIVSTGPVYTKKGTETYLQCAIGDVADELLPLLRFHDNWKYLNFGNLLEEHDYTWRDVNKGYTAITDVGAYMSGDYMYDIQATEHIPLLARLYLDRIAALCDEHGSELILMTVPAASGWNHARHNGIRDYAEERGLTYLDYNTPELNPGIDWRTDTPDGGAHLNVLGARKLTAALGTYLTENFALPDHRGTALYEDWDADAATYTAAMTELVATNEAAAAYQLEQIGHTA